MREHTCSRAHAPTQTQAFKHNTERHKNIFLNWLVDSSHLCLSPELPVIWEERAGVAGRVNRRWRANQKGLPLGTRLSKQWTIVTNTDTDAWLWNAKKKKKERKIFACETWDSVCFNNQMYLYCVWIEIVHTEGGGDMEDESKGEKRVS